MEKSASRAKENLNRRKSRPSRARGLRTSTGCLTCRKRRIKCDESRPKCGPCCKLPRECDYGESETREEPGTPLSSSRISNDDSSLRESYNNFAPENGTRNDEQVKGSTSELSVSRHEAKVHQFTTINDNASILDIETSYFPVPAARSGSSFDTTNGAYLNDNNLLQTQSDLDHNISPILPPSLISSSPGAAPFVWYQLLAEDAISNIEEYSFLSHDLQWDFDPSTFLQRSHVPSSSPQIIDEPALSKEKLSTNAADLPSLEDSNLEPRISEPWNTLNRLVLEPEEIVLFRHFVKNVGPILDLFDSSNHFTNIVPQLALRNVGLMKSMLAVAAMHISLSVEDESDEPSTHSETPFSSTSHTKSEKHLAVQYYYETLAYLSQAMQYPSYTRSSEILATAIMISTYEMFDHDSRDWERHLKGAFWIQRSQDNDGESRGLQKAVWWAWLRQDIWAAFRHKRKTMTFWRPTKPLCTLEPDELACRSLYLLAKSIEYISDEKNSTQDLAKRIEEGERHLRALDEWHNSLPSSFTPVPIAKTSQSLYEPIWIHPPAYAAAVQTYCFAKIVILLNMPSIGGINEYHDRLKTLDDMVDLICGLAQYPNDADPSLAFVSVQCLFAAGQCVRIPEKQAALLKILEDSIRHCKWLRSSLVDDLKNIWLTL